MFRVNHDKQNNNMSHIKQIGYNNNVHVSKGFEIQIFYYVLSEIKQQIAFSLL